MIDVILCPRCQQEIPMSELLESQLHDRLAKEGAKLATEAKKKAEAALAIELTDLKQQAAENEQKISEMQTRELELRAAKRQVEKEKQAMDLLVERKLDVARRQVEEETTKRVLEEKRLQDLEKEKQLTDLKQQIEALKHKAEVGSQQSRGEIQELDLESMLQTAFSDDAINPVGKGVLGADVIQHVRNRYGKLCEKIIWESKRTKHWSDQWVDKLKDDSRKMNGFVSVIVSDTLPENVKSFAYYNGIWVTDYHSIIGLATALRQQIIHVCHVRDSMTGKDEKMTLLYDYLTSHQFRDRVEAIVETFQGMRLDLDKEMEAYRRIWAKREKGIERITENTIGMYGEMQGLVGSGLPTLPALDLIQIAEETTTEDIP